jgi:hypothetical protein
MAPAPFARRIYQAIALTSLVAIYAAAVELGVRHVAPVATIVDLLGAWPGGFVTWILATLVWALAMLPIRPMAKFPTLAESMKSQGIEGPADFARVVEERRRGLRAARVGTPDERRRYHLMMSGGGAILAVVSGLASAANLSIAPDTFFLLPPVLCFLSIALLPYHLVRAALAR